jgi:transcriptional regulator with XRE-family HTH domain
MMIDQVTADQWRMARAALSMSRADIATRVGISANAIAIAETAPANLSLDLLDKLGRYYKAKGITFTVDAGRVTVMLLRA